MTGLNESVNDKLSSKRFGKNQKSYPSIQTNRKRRARTVIRKKIKMRKVTDMYQTKTFKKLGQMGKHVQKRNPAISAVVII
jgi:hypothetical protein